MINKVILLGNVGQDPEVRTLESGVKVVRLRLATTERIFNRQTNESTDHTEWHTITLWRGLAEVADKFVRKGSQLYIEGRLRSREWEKDGQRHFGIEIVADDMKLLGRRADNQQMGASQQPQYQSAPQPQYQSAPQPQYQSAPQPQYQSAPQPQYQSAPQPQYQSAPQPQYQSVQQPVAPQMPADDPDDLPF